MDITPQDNTTQPISDDQELAKALAGVLPDEPIAPEPATPVVAPPVVAPAPVLEPVAPEAPAFDATQFATPEPTVNLDSIKSQALTDLRPLIDRVDLPPEERFDAYLMLLRSTDDSTLVAPAHAAAQGISDEKRKAEALLEVIKEIDYLSRKDA
jgi:hypothetical protein